MQGSNLYHQFDSCAGETLYWRLGVLYFLGDDASRIRKGNGLAIMASIRHLCMSLFEREPSSISPAKKRLVLVP